MKICFIAPKAYALFNNKNKSVFGGAEVQLSLLAKEIATQDNLDVHFMVADYGQRNIETYDKVKVWKSINFKKNIFAKIIDFFTIFKQINAQIYVQRSLTFFSGIIAFYCKKNNKKFIYMVAHDSETNQTHSLYKKKISAFLTKLVFRYATIIVTQNSLQTKNLKDQNIKCTLIRSGHKITSIDWIEKPKKHFLWVSRSDTWKRPQFLLQLALAFPKETFIMVCPKSTNTTNQEYDKLVKKIQSTSNIHLKKFVPFNAIDALFFEAKAFINTSTMEGFPNTFIQAAKNGVPILSLNVNPNNFLTEHQCGFYCQNDMELLKDNLLTLATDKALYQKMSANAYQYAKENHDIQLNTQKLLDLIK